MRWLTHGSTDDPRSLDARLWKRIDKNGPTGCWIWTGGVNVHGYGQIMENGKNLRVHRVVWERLVGPIPSGMILCHACDWPPCCNPAHMFVGTMQDNTQDMMQKGRNANGSLASEVRAERLAATKAKVCPRCEVQKPPEDFGPNRARKDGLQTYCHPCLVAYRRERHAARELHQGS